MEFSSSTVFFWSSVLVLLHVLVSASKKLKYSKLPPGPSPLPIVGNILQLGTKPHESLAMLAKTYGPLMTVKLGSVTTIVVSSPNMAQEFLQKHDQTFSGRPVRDCARIFRHDELSMACLPPSHEWRNLRKLCTTQMFTTQRLGATERIRLMKVDDLLEYIEDKSKSRLPVYIGQAVFAAILNMLSNTMFSIDLASFSSDSVRDFKDVVRGIMEEAGRPNVADYFPLLKPFDPQGVRRRMTGYYGKLDKLFDTIIAQRLESKEQNASVGDFLHILLHHTQEDGSKLPSIEIKSILADLFIAGTDTSSSTVEWAMAELLRNPDVLAKAKLELKEQINKERLMNESDISRLPYLQAIVKETLRLHPAAPLLVPHRAENEMEVCGFTVPRHAQVLVNAWAIGRDPEVWENPTSFLPERFLGSNVDFRGRDWELIPFGAGRRICPGLPLAYRMVHLILASLLHSFGWEVEGGVGIDMDEKFGLALEKATPLIVVPILD